MDGDMNKSDGETEQRLMELDKRVRDRGLAALGINGTREELVEFYSQVAGDYHELGDLAKYEVYGCRALAKALAEWLPNTDARILDVAAGSGLVGRQLRQLNYTNIDALDPSVGMTNVAKAENIYRHYIMDVVSADKKTDVNDATYDAICIGGSVIKGHITLDCLPELLRITKKGGVIAFNIGEKYLKRDAEFQDDKHHTIFQRYLDSGQFLKWDHFTAPYRYTENCVIYRMVVS